MRLKNMLDEKNLIIKEKNPFNLFSKWYELAIQKESNDPNAMNLSTVSKKSKPSNKKTATEKAIEIKQKPISLPTPSNSANIPMVDLPEKQEFKG